MPVHNGRSYIHNTYTRALYLSTVLSMCTFENFYFLEVHTSTPLRGKYCTFSSPIVTRLCFNRYPLDCWLVCHKDYTKIAAWISTKLKWKMIGCPDWSITLTLLHSAGCSSVCLFVFYIFC